MLTAEQRETRICPIHGVSLFRIEATHGFRFECPTEGCDVRCADGTTSTPCDLKTSLARQSAHDIFDPLHRGGRERRFQSRNDAYVWLAESMNLPLEQAHFGMFSLAQCKRAKRIIRTFLNGPNPVAVAVDVPLPVPVQLIPPGPGIYEGVNFETYASWPYINNSGLTRFLRSPAHYKAALDTDDDTAAKTRGTICHAGILEPERFEKEYAIGPDVKLNTKAGKEEWETFVSANPGKYHVRGADGAAMLGCREAIWSHRWAVELLRSEGPSEVCIVWDDVATGLRCKARVDKAARGLASCAADLKTTRDARREAFERSIWTYGYHRQAAFTLHGLASLGMTLDKFYIIPVEPEPPYALMVYEVEHAAIEAGRVEIVAAMIDFAECKRIDKWPGYSEEPEFIGLPDFVRRREQYQNQSYEVSL